MSKETQKPKTYLSEREYQAMEYALRYAKKAGIDKALAEVRRDLLAVQKANHSREQTQVSLTQDQ